MQSSSSFSDTRSGRPRPANILSGRPAPSESLPWPSPSFDMATGSNVAADPGRPSTQIKNGSLPPTPLTASSQKLPSLLPAVSNLSLGSSSAVAAPIKLPGVDELVAQTPPPSVGLVSRELPSESSLAGPSSSDPYVLPLPGSMPASSSRRTSMPLTREQFNNIPSSDTVCGLGLELGEETPRLGDLMSTPRMNTVRRGASLASQDAPGAPMMTSNESGRFATHPYPAGLVSPLQPPLRNWNTNLFSESMTCPRPPPRRTSTATSADMERERTVQIEGDLPMGHKLWGLGISFDEGRTFKRGRDVYDGDGKLIEEGSKGEAEAAMPPTPTQRGSAKKTPRTAERPSVHRDNSSASVSSSSSMSASAASPTLPGSATRATKTTGLTPHVHKTRLTPTVAASRKAGSPTGVGAGDASEGASPSLKMKSKQRSEQLRNQVAAVTKANNLASDYSLSSSSSTLASSVASTSSSASSGNNSPQVKQRRPKTASPSKGKRGGGLRAKDINVASPNMQSPWGVFELGGSKAWQPLGAPSMKDPGHSASSVSEKGKAPVKRQQQQQPTDRDEVMSPPLSSKSKKGLSSSADVFGGSRPNSASGAGQGTFASQQRQQQQQRRTVNLR